MGLLDRAVDKLKTEQEEQGAGSGKTEVRAPAEPAIASERSARKRESRSARALDAEAPRLLGGSVKLDLAGLARSGFVVPGQPCDSALLDESRRIKRELLFKMAMDQADDGEESSKPANVVMITSAVANEGKTFVAINLAFSISIEVDHTILLVDGDVIRRGASRQLGVEDRLGLTDYLLGECDDIEEMLVTPEGIDNMRILPAGSRHENVNELLASERMQELVVEMAARYPDRVVLIDSPPLLLTSEAAVLAQQMGQIAMVVRADVTAQHHVNNALAALPPETFSGLILNRATRNLAADGYTDYRYE